MNRLTVRINFGKVSGCKSAGCPNGSGVCNKMLSYFNIYPLVQHKYKYKEEEIIFYNTNLNNENWKLSENSYIFSILKTDERLKDSQAEDGIRDARE